VIRMNLFACLISLLFFLIGIYYAALFRRYNSITSQNYSWEKKDSLARTIGAFVIAIFWMYLAFTVKK